MKVIEVTEFTAPVGKELDAAAYPHEGAFIDSYRIMRIVYRLEGSSSRCIMYVGVVAETTFAETAVRNDVQIGITESTLLKALAITQKPDLALELTK